MTEPKREYRVLRPINVYGEYQRKGSVVLLTDDAALQVIDRIEALDPQPVPAPAEAGLAEEAPQGAPAAGEAAPASPQPVPAAPAAGAQDGKKDDLGDL